MLINTSNKNLNISDSEESSGGITLEKYTQEQFIEAVEEDNKILSKILSSRVSKKSNEYSNKKSTWVRFHISNNSSLVSSHSNN